MLLLSIANVHRFRTKRTKWKLADAFDFDASNRFFIRFYSVVAFFFCLHSFRAIIKLFRRKLYTRLIKSYFLLLFSSHFFRFESFCVLIAFCYNFVSVFAFEVESKTSKDASPLFFTAVKTISRLINAFPVLRKLCPDALLTLWKLSL